MKLFKLANQESVDVKNLLSLPSAFGLRASSDVSTLLQRKLLRELGQLPVDVGAPQTAPLLKPGPRPVQDVPELVARPDTAGPLAVHQLARQLGTYKDDVIEVLRAVTGQGSWSADSVVDDELIALTRVEYARRRAPEGAVRRAAAARPRAARPLHELSALRVQAFKPPGTPGEKALEAALRRMPAGIALVGVDIAGYDRTTDVDAIVVMPNLLATVEVKDTTRVGTISAFVNGPWEVDGQPFQGHGVGPTNQAMQQARVLGSARKERPELASLQRVPATIGVHGRAYFETRPLYVVSPDCFSYNVDDTVEALRECADKLQATVNVGHVQALFAWLRISSSMCFTRQELEMFGFAEFAA